MTEDSHDPIGRERRKRPRYPHGDLRVQVHKPGLGGMLRTPPTVCVDFSLSGLQVTTRQSFHVGEQVVLDLRLLDVHIHEMRGIVCTARADDQEATGYRYGIRFCFEAGKYMRTISVSDCLRRIASYLNVNRVYS